MNKLIYSLLIVLLVVIISCTNTNESDVATAQKIKEIVPEEKIKETTLQPLNESAKKVEPKDPFLETPVHECAIFSRDDGIKYCDFPRQGSEKTEFSCQQAFSSGGRPPYDQVGIKILTFESSSEAKEKFAVDTFNLQGTKIKPYLSISETNQNQRVAEFYKGKKLVRIVEVPINSCKGFDKLVEMAFVKA